MLRAAGVGTILYIRQGSTLISLEWPDPLPNCYTEKGSGDAGTLNQFYWNAINTPCSPLPR